MFKPKATLGGLQEGITGDYSTIVISAGEIEAAVYSIEHVATGEIAKGAVDLVNARASHRASADVNVYTGDGVTLTGLTAAVTQKLQKTVDGDVERLCFIVYEKMTGNFVKFYASFPGKSTDLDSKVYSAIGSATKPDVLSEIVEITKKRTSTKEYEYYFKGRWTEFFSEKGKLDFQQSIDYRFYKKLIFRNPGAEFASNFTASGDLSSYSVESSGDYIKKSLSPKLTAFDENGVLTGLNVNLKQTTFNKSGIVGEKCSFTIIDTDDTQLGTFGGFIPDTKKPSGFNAEIYSTKYSNLLGNLVNVYYIPNYSPTDSNFICYFPKNDNNVNVLVPIKQSNSKSLYVSLVAADEAAFKANFTPTSDKAIIDERFRDPNAQTSLSAQVDTYEDNDIKGDLKAAISSNSFRGSIEKESGDLALNLSSGDGVNYEGRLNAEKYIGGAVGFHETTYVDEQHPLYLKLSDSTEIKNVGSTATIAYIRDRIAPGRLAALEITGDFYCSNNECPYIPK